MRRARLVSMGAAGCLAALCAWVALRPGAPSGSDLVSDRAPDAAASHPAMVLQGAPVVQQAPRGRCRLSGRVIRDGRPVAARVEVQWRAEPAAALLPTYGHTAGVRARYALPPQARDPLALTTEDASGRFELEELASGAYEIRARTSDQATATLGVLLPVDGSSAQIELVVEPASELVRGRIQHADGRAFQGAAFVGRPPAETTPWPVSLGSPLRVGDDGTFEVSGLPRGPARVAALDPDGLCVYGPEVTLPTAEPYVLTLGEAPGRSGRVLAREDGTPIADALVIGSATTATGGSLIAETRTDTAGRWSLGLPARGVTAVRALAPGFAMARIEGGRLPGATQPIELRLAKEAVLAGRVVAASDGRPVPGVTVRVLPDRRYGDFFAPAPVISDESGAFEVRGLPPGEAVVVAEGDGWAPARLEAQAGDVLADALTVLLVAGGVTQHLVEVEPAGGLRGRVLDAEGRPVSGAVVSAHGRAGGGSYYMNGARENLRPAAVTTNAQGEFELEGLATGCQHVLRVRAPSGAEGHSGLLRASREPQAPVEIRIPAVRVLQVRVEDVGTAAPLASAGIRREEGDDRDAPVLDWTMDWWTTGPDGEARLEVEAGRPLRLSVGADGYGTPTTADVGPDQVRLVVRLARHPTVAGHVIHEDGRPAPWASVRVYPAAPQPLESVAWVSTDESGAFRADLPASGTVRMRARGQVAGELVEGEAVGAADADPVTVTLQPMRTVPPRPGVPRVRMLDNRGRPVHRAEISVVGEGSGSAYVECGWAELEGRWWVDRQLIVEGARDEDGVSLPVGPAHLGPLPASSPDVEIRLPAEATIQGVVRGPDGHGLAQARLRAHRDMGDGDFDWHVASETRSDGEGRFRLGSLGPGMYALSVSIPSHGLRKVRGIEAGRSDVVIELGAVTQAKVTVVDESGAGIHGARVRVTSADEGVVVEAWTDPLGEARLVGLPLADDLTLRVMQGRGWNDEVAESLTEHWSAADTTVRLIQPPTLTGRVVDRAGQAVADAEVEIWTRNNMWPATSDREGRFRVVGRMEGEVSVKLVEDLGPPVKVTDLRREVVLLYEPGLEVSVQVEGWIGLPPRTGSAELHSPPGDERSRWTARVDAAGVAVFRNLRPDTTYTLWVPPTSDGRSLLLPDVRPGSAPLRVALQQGRSIRGRVLLPPNTDIQRVSASLPDLPSLRVEALVQPDGTYEVRGLPDGQWLVEVLASDDSIRTRSGLVDAGGTLDLDLRTSR